MWCFCWNYICVHMVHTYPECVHAVLSSHCIVVCFNFFKSLCGLIIPLSCINRVLFSCKLLIWMLKTIFKIILSEGWVQNWYFVLGKFPKCCWSVILLWFRIFYGLNIQVRDKKFAVGDVNLILENHNSLLCFFNLILLFIFLCFFIQPCSEIFVLLFSFYTIIR